MIKNRIMLKIIISVIVIVISIPSLSLYGTEDLHADTNIIQPSNDDTFISEGDPSKTWGSEISMFAGTHTDGTTEHVSLVKFSMSNVPPSNEIISVKLYLYLMQTFPSNSPGVSLNCFRLLNYWTESSATWNNVAAGSWAVSCDAASTISASGSYSWYSWDVTNEVKGFKSGSYSNYGFAIVPKNWNSPNGYAIFFTKEYSSSGNRPKLQIVHSKDPNPPNLVSPSDNQITNDNTPYFDWSFSDPDSGDNQDGYRVQIDNTNSFSSVNYDSEIHSSSSTHWQFPSGTSYTTISDGIWYWRVKTEDNHGCWGSYCNYHTLVVDTIAPASLSISIDNGDSYTTSTSVTLAFSASDGSGSGLDDMMISNSASFSGASWESYFTSKPWTLESGDGNKTVYFKVKDAAGNEATAVSDSITLDGTVPNSLSISINDGDDYTMSTSVTLTLSASDGSGSGLDKMMISNSASFSGASWESYSTSKPWTLESGDGSKSVYFKVRDIAGNEATAVSDSITLDGTVPNSLSISINDGDDYTMSTSVTLTLSASDGSGSGLDKMMISNSVSYSGASWESYSTSKPWTLESGDGSKSVYFKVRDIAGNEVTSVSDSINLDGTAPNSLSISINDGDDYTMSTSVTLTLSASDGSGLGLDKMMISNSVSFSGASWESYSTSKPWTLESGNGNKTVYFKVKDIAGNEANEVNDSIFLDETVPTITHTRVLSWTEGSSIIILAKAKDSNSNIKSITLFYKITTSSSYTIISMTSNEENAYSAVIPESLVTLDGISYYIKAIDNAGNTVFFRDDGQSETEPTSTTDIDIIITDEDLTPPTITHEKITFALVETNITIIATVIDSSGVDSVTLCYKKSNDSSFLNSVMSRSGNTYTGTIVTNSNTSDDIGYYIKAVDNTALPNIAYFGESGQTIKEPTLSTSIHITVSDKPPQLDYIIINPLSGIISILVGKNQQQFSATCYDTNNNEVGSLALTWTVIGGIGTIDETGLFTATNIGKGKVKVSATLEELTKYSEANITIVSRDEEIPICDITSPKEGDIVSGTIIVTGIASIINGTIVRVEVCIDYGAWLPADGTYAWQFECDTIKLSNDKHKIHTRAFDGTYYSPVQSINIIVNSMKDTDNDGIPDETEKKYGLNPLINDSLIDNDKDGIPNLWEIQNGLNPLNSNDALEDFDKDGFSNLDEYNKGSNPNDPYNHPEIIIAEKEPPYLISFVFLIICIPFAIFAKMVEKKYRIIPYILIWMSLSGFALTIFYFYFFSG